MFLLCLSSLYCMQGTAYGQIECPAGPSEHWTVIGRRWMRKFFFASCTPRLEGMTLCISNVEKSARKIEFEEKLLSVWTPLPLYKGCFLWAFSKNIACQNSLSPSQGWLNLTWQLQTTVLEEESSVCFFTCTVESSRSHGGRGSALTCYQRLSLNLLPVNLCCVSRPPTSGSHSLSVSLKPSLVCIVSSCKVNQVLNCFNMLELIPIKAMFWQVAQLLLYYSHWFNYMPGSAFVDRGCFYASIVVKLKG